MPRVFLLADGHIANNFRLCLSEDAPFGATDFCPSFRHTAWRWVDNREGPVRSPLIRVPDTRNVGILSKWLKS